jgi:hypothetical protein
LYLEVEAVRSVLENSVVTEKLPPFLVPLLLHRSELSVHCPKLVFEILGSLGRS